MTKQGHVDHATSVVYEVITAGSGGSCLYRGADIELACKVYDAAPGEGAVFRRLAGGRWRRVALPPVPEPDADEDAVFWLTSKGYAALERDAALFVVDTADVGDLMARCPELLADGRVA
jgi:hypothetical protein